MRYFVVNFCKRIQKVVDICTLYIWEASTRNNFVPIVLAEKASYISNTKCPMHVLDVLNTCIKIVYSGKEGFIWWPELHLTWVFWEVIYLK